MNWKRFLVAVFAALLFLPSVSMAQSIVTGGIAGTVTDPSGAVIVGATLTLKNPATGESLTGTSNGTGGFQFTLLQPGTYTLAVTQSGFKQASESVEVHLGQISTVNLKMEVGSGSVTVEVTGQGALLQTEDANISTNFDTHAITNVPNPGGDITNIAQQAPGVSMNTTGSGYGNFSAFGLPGTANLFTINGNDYNDPFLNLNNSGSSNLLLGGNELQEVAVVVNGYTGQYGRQAGAQIDYTTKGGGNSFHGDLVYDWTGRVMNANDYFNNHDDVGRPFSNNNQWAASLGGPILKDKLFFFANTEGLRYILPTSTDVFTPTLPYEAYILSQAPIASSPTATAFYNNVFSLYNATTARNPQAAPALGSCGASSGYPAFLGDTSVGGVNTACLNNFQETGANQNKEWLVDGRVDYVLSDKDKIFGRAKFDRGSQPTYTDPISPLFNALSIQPEDDGQLNYTHVFSPTVVNSFVGSVLYYSAIFANQNQSAALATFPGILSSLDSALTPLGTTSGDFPFGFFFPQGRNVTQYQLVDDVSVTRGRNAFKMGMNFRRVDWSDHTSGQLVPNPGLTVSALGFEQNQIFEPGIGGSIQQNFSTSLSQPLSNYSIGLYFQDQLRINSKLTLTLTMRVDRNSPGGCATDCGTRPIAPFDTMPHGSDIPFNQNFLSGFHQILPNVEKIVPEPRIGFAWTPFGDKTVFRGGVGLFTDLYPAAILNAYTNNFPQVNRFNISAGTVAFANPVAAGDTTSGAALAAGCNAAFSTAYATGGTLGSYVASDPTCVDSSGNPLVANYNDPNDNVKNPKFIEWNFEVQHSIGAHTVVSANYVGNRGYDIFLFNPYKNAYDNAAVSGIGEFGGLPTASLDSRVATVDQVTNNGYSNYNGISLSVQQNFWKGLTARLNYTYSHALDNVSNGGSGEPYSAFSNVSITNQVDPFNPKAQYGPADYDIRHYISGNYVYEFPFKSESRLMNAAIGGWMVSGTVYYHTGLPFTLVDGITAGSIASENDSLATVLPQAIAPIASSCNHNAVTTPCFVNGQFAGNTNPPPTGFITNVGRNSIRAPGYFNTDFSIRKNFKLNERFNFQVGANAYNVLNHVNFQAPLGNLAFGPGAFGQIVSTVTPPTSVFGAFANGNADARVLQVQGKLTF